MSQSTVDILNSLQQGLFRRWVVAGTIALAVVLPAVISPPLYADSRGDANSRADVYEVGGVPVERLSTRVSSDKRRDRLDQINTAPPTSAGESEGMAGSAGAVTTPGSSQEQSSMWELYSQLEVLQEELGQLRGTIESQSRELETLKRQQKEHYIDLDHRIALLGKATSGLNSGANTKPKTPQVGAGSGGAAIVQATPTTVPTGSEKERYNSAIELVRSKKLPQAEEAFRQFLSDYPVSIYTANAHYWLGEVYLALPNADQDKARMHFETVTTQFPTHSKASACMYKLGVLHHRQGDKEKAKSLFQSVISRFPGSPAAGLAEKGLSRVSQ